MIPAAAPRRRCCVFPCDVSLVWLIIALSAAAVGWALFVVAIVAAGRAHQHMKGWEWVAPFLLAPFSWLGLTAVRRQRPGDSVITENRAIYYTERFFRVLWVGVCYTVALILYAVVVPVQYLHFAVVDAPTGSMSLPKNTAPVAYLLYAQAALLVFATFAYWQYGELLHHEDQAREQFSSEMAEL